MTDQQNPEGLRFAERLAWLGFMAFFVVVLAIYIARGIGLERDVTTANRELLEAQLRLAQYTRDEVPRPVVLGLSNAQLQNLQRRGMARPESQLRRHLLDQEHLLPSGDGFAQPLRFHADGIHVLNDRWILAHLTDGGDRHGQMLLAYEVVHGNVLWQVLDVFVD